MTFINNLNIIAVSLANSSPKISYLEEQNNKLLSEVHVLCSDLESTRNNVVELHAINKAQRLELDQMKQHILLMKQALFGKKSEKTADNKAQMDLLFNEAECYADNSVEKAEYEEKIVVKKKKGGGRKPLPKDLPRERVIHELAEADLQCDCGGELEHIGEETSEELDVIPAKILVKEHVCYKYACKFCHENVKKAPAPFRPLNKTIASSGLLSDVLVKKYSDHLPLYRQTEIWKRYDIDLPRSTLSNWVIGCAYKLEPLVALLKEEILSSDYICSDETTLNVLKESKQTNYMWVHQSGERERRSVVYEYNKSRSKEVANAFLEGFSGYHQGDGYAGYNDVHAKKGVTGVGCMAHARRKFMALVKISNSRGVAHEIVSLMNELYTLEKKISGLTADEIKARRHERARPILDELLERLNFYKDKAVPKGTLSSAINYSLNQWDKLTAYLEDGRLRIDNNDAERAIKPFVLGRKNWLFSNTEGGAKASCVVYSLIETCKANKVNSFYYLKYILENIHKAENNDQLRQMLPFNLNPEILKRKK